jgi:hypothetical protein
METSLLEEKGLGSEDRMKRKREREMTEAPTEVPEMENTDMTKKWTRRAFLID